MEAGLNSGHIAPDRVAALGTKLAAVYLLDGNPRNALAALARTSSASMTPKEKAERQLLKARALSQTGKLDEAIETLSGLESVDARKLKIDVFWRGQKWAEAAFEIERLLPHAPAKLDAEQARLVINMAVAYKLANNDEKLQEIKGRYTTAMKATDLDATFGVVTRKGGIASLSDRDTLLKMSGEVDMFKSFLESYKASAGKDS